MNRDVPQLSNASARRISEAAVSAGVVAVGILVVTLSWGIPAGATADPIGPRGFPIGLGVLLIIFGTWLLFARSPSLRGGGTPPPAVETFEEGAESVTDAEFDTRRVTIAIGVVTLYVVVLPLASYVPATVAAAAAMMWLVGERRWLALVTLPFAISLTVYLALDVVLSIRLP